MSVSKQGHPPQQSRSRETLQRLLNATARLLDQHGLDGALIPRIAELAKVAPASVYRRFADKDALLRATLLHVLRTSQEANHKNLPSLILGRTLEDTAARFVSLLFKQYREHPHLMRAVVRFLDTDTDAAFASEARSLLAQNVRSIAEIVLTHRSRIRHPDPERAVSIAILAAGSSIEVIALEPTSLWHTVLPSSDQEYAAEITASFVAYLRQKH